GLRPIPVLEHREFQRFSTVDEHSAAQAGLILDDPVAAAVLADAEQGFRTIGRGRLTVTTRGRFAVAHGTSPFDASTRVPQMCKAAHMNSRGKAGQPHKCDIEAARAAEIRSTRPRERGGWSDGSKPVENVVGQRSEDTNCERTPDNPQQQHGTRALDKSA